MLGYWWCIIDDGLLRPWAYFSRKNSLAECNYEIHDRELLAIISCLREWESELSSVRHFKVITDHKNLRYFMTQRRLNERQMRWAAILSRYDFTLQYRPGKLASRPDAESCEQDMPVEGDKRLEFRDVRLFNPDAFIGNAVFVTPIAADAPGLAAYLGPPDPHVVGGGASPPGEGLGSLGRIS
jgi:RNase H-like domain found in reverse transcriptase